MNKLSDRTIKNAKPGEKPRKLSDGGGLYIEVHPNGSKYWRLKYRYRGKEKRLALGVYGPPPNVSLSNAREKRDDAKRMLAEGLDPSAEKKKEKHAKLEAASNTFEAVAREWVSKKRAEWKKNHADSVLRELEADLFPALGSKAIAEITAPELLAVLRAIEARRAYETLKKARQRAGAIFRFGVVTGRCDRDVAADLRGAFASPRTKSHNALSADELPEFLRRLDAYDGHPQTGLALWLILLTFVRTSELRGARWEEFDLDSEQPMWRIPSERMKMNEEHLVPLSRQAIDVLRELIPLAGKSELVLPGRSSLDKPISENTLLYAMYRLGYHSRATVHGFRTTASTILNEQGWKPDVIERQLAHAERNAVRAAYNRAEYLPDRRRMMQAWADYLDSLQKDKVLDFPQRKAN